MRNHPRFVATAVVTCCLLVCDGQVASAGNSITVESRSVAIGAHGVTVAIKISNDVPVGNIVLPLVIRSRTPGAYITALTAQRTPGGRLDGVLTGIDIITTRATESGSCKGGQPGGFPGVPSTPDFVSPDGVLFALGKFMPTEPPLAPGKDSTTGSLMLTFDVTDTLVSCHVSSVG